MPTGNSARSTGVLIGENGEGMQKIFLWFLFFLGAVPPVLFINPIMGRKSKIGFGYLVAIFGYMLFYLFAVYVAFIFAHIELSQEESNRIAIGWGVGFFLTLCCTNIEVWDYVRPATRSAMRALLAVSKFVVMVTREYVFPALRWCGIKIYEKVTKKKYTKKEKKEEGREEKENGQSHTEFPKTEREKSIQDVLNKLDNL